MSKNALLYIQLLKEDVPVLKGRKNTITNNERFMIQYVLTENSTEHHDIALLE